MSKIPRLTESVTGNALSDIFQETGNEITNQREQERGI